jgi:hypothetical protein
MQLYQALIKFILARVDVWYTICFAIRCEIYKRMPDDSAEGYELILKKWGIAKIKMGHSHCNLDRESIGSTAWVPVILPSDSVNDIIDPYLITSLSWGGFQSTAPSFY